MPASSGRSPAGTQESSPGSERKERRTDCSPSKYKGQQVYVRSKGFTGSTKAAAAVTEPEVWNAGNVLVVKGQSPRRPRHADSPEDEREVASKEIMQSYTAKTVLDARHKA